MEISNIVKFASTILLVFLLFKEYKMNKNYKKSTIFLGLYAMLCLIASPAPWLSVFIGWAFALAWFLIYKFKISKLNSAEDKNGNGGKIFFYYILPIVLSVASYTIGLFVGNGMAALYVGFKISEVIVAMFLISSLIYLIILMIKILVNKIKNKTTFKMSYKSCEIASFIPCLILPYLSMAML